MHEERPLLSIIVPIYNVEQYLHKCIQKLLEPSIINFELLLIDDGSPDNAGKICDEYARLDARIKVLHKKNGGLCSARNAGLEIAKGEWVTFVDPDDWIENIYFETFLEAIKCDSDLIVCGNNLIKGEIISTMLPLKSYCTNRDSIEKTIFHLKWNKFGFNFFGYTWNKFFKNSIIQKHHLQFIEGLNISEDEVFVDEYCYYIKSLQVVDISIYNYLIRQGGLTKQPNSFREYMLLTTQIIIATKYYNYKPLIKLMQEEVLSYMYKGIKEGYKEKVKINFALKRIYVFYNRYSFRTELNLNKHLRISSKSFFQFRIFIYLKLFIRYGLKL